MVIDIQDTNNQVRDFKAKITYTIEREITIRTDNYHKDDSGMCRYNAKRENLKKMLQGYNPVIIFKGYELSIDANMERVDNDFQNGEIEQEEKKKIICCLQEEKTIIKGWKCTESEIGIERIDDED